MKECEERGDTQTLTRLKWMGGKIPFTTAEDLGLWNESNGWTHGAESDGFGPIDGVGWGNSTAGLIDGTWCSNRTVEWCDERAKQRGMGRIRMVVQDLVHPL